jgi:hypothetical protein
MRSLASDGAPMTQAEREQRALRLELLRVRAAAERAELTRRLDTIDARTRTGRAMASALLGGSRADARGLLGVAASALRIVRRQPWIVPTVVGGMLRVARSRRLRWVLLAGAVVGALWWIRRTHSAAEAPEDTAEEAAANDEAGAP